MKNTFCLYALLLKLSKEIQDTPTKVFAKTMDTINVPTEWNIKQQNIIL